MKINWKDIGKRAAKTFVQATLSALAVGLVTVDLSDINAVKSALIVVGVGALAAGVSAVMNMVAGAIEIKKDGE